MIVLDNKVLMAFLFSKYTLALKKGVIINYKLKSTVSYIKCTDFDLIEIIGILIDNAIEATQDLNEPEFDLIIDKFNCHTIIETRNKTEYLTSNDIKIMFKKDSSTKKSENRGVGLYKLQKLLEKNEGTIETYYDTDTRLLIFSIKIL